MKIISLIGWLAFGSLAASADNKLATPADPDSIGTKLSQSFVWVKDRTVSNVTLHAGFRRTFELSLAPTQARVSLFAYTRYQLFVNGEYVGRGPNRFENRRPEYDTWDITSRLRRGQR